METTNKKITYVIEVKAFGEKRRVYIVLDNGERRKIFTIVRHKYGYLLKYSTNRELGSLIDVVGMQYIHDIGNVIFRFLTYKTSPAKYKFSAVLTDVPQKSFKFYKGLNAYVEDRIFDRLN